MSLNFKGASGGLSSSLKDKVEMVDNSKGRCGVVPRKERSRGQLEVPFQIFVYWNTGEELLRKGTFAWRGGDLVSFLQKAGSFLFLSMSSNRLSRF